MDDLAQELIDAILDFLHDDPPSLLSSSLVARKWVPTARHHLFASVSVYHCHLPRNRGAGFKDTAHQFLDICRSPHCSILSPIREAVVNINTDFCPQGSVPDLLRNVIKTLGRAPIRKLVFVDPHWFLEPTSLSWIAPYFPDLQELAYNALGRVAVDIFVLLSSCPTLRVLSLYSNYKDSPSPSIARGPYPAVSFAHLHTLRARLYPSQSEELLSWLGSANLRLESLHLNLFHSYHNGWGPVSALNALLGGENAAHLRDLALCVTYEDSDSDVDDVARVNRPSEGELDFSALTSLRTLHLTTHSVNSACCALASLLPSTLRVLRYDFSHWLYYEEAPCRCSPAEVRQFVAVMQGAQFDALERFDLGVPEYFGDAGIVMLRDHFGRWKDDSRMRIERTEEEYQVDTWESVSRASFGA